MADVDPLATQRVAARSTASTSMPCIGCSTGPRPTRKMMGPFATVYGRCFDGMAARYQLDIPAALENSERHSRSARESDPTRTRPGLGQLTPEAIWRGRPRSVRNSGCHSCWSMRDSRDAQNVRHLPSVRTMAIARHLARAMKPALSRRGSRRGRRPADRTVGMSSAHRTCTYCEKLVKF